MIDQKSLQRRQRREAKMTEETERIRLTEDFLRAEAERKERHRAIDMESMKE
jgi:hypothetical protein